MILLTFDDDANVDIITEFMPITDDNNRWTRAYVNFTILNFDSFF